MCGKSDVVKRSAAKAQAIKDGLKRYEGKPCKKCGTTLRHVSNGCCIVCLKAYAHSPQSKAYNSSLERKAYYKVRNATPEDKAYHKARNATPERKAKSRIYHLKRSYGISETDYRR